MATPHALTIDYEDCCVRSIDLVAGSVTNESADFPSPFSIALSSSGECASIATNQDTFILDPTSLDILHRIPTGWAFSTAISPDNQYIAAGTYESTVVIVSAASFTVTATLAGHGSVVYAVGFSPSSAYLASGSDDNSVIIWSVSAFTPLHNLKQHTSSVRALTFISDTMLASGGADRTIRVWSPVNGECVKVITDHVDWVRGFAVSRDGAMFASCSNDKTLKIFDVPSLTCIRTIPCANYVQRACFFGSDMIVIGVLQSQMVVANIHTGEVVSQLAVHHWPAGVVIVGEEGALLTLVSISNTDCSAKTGSAADYHLMCVSFAVRLEMHRSLRLFVVSRDGVLRYLVW